MSWTITVTLQILLQIICGCAADVLDHYLHRTILLQTISGHAVDVLDHYCHNAILLQTICGCAVDVLDHYSNYTILPQTIPGWAVILDSHSHDTILFLTMCRSLKRLPRPPLNVVWAYHYICTISSHCCRPSLKYFNTTIIFILYRMIVTPSFLLDLFHSPKSLHKWLGCAGIFFFFFTCQTRQIV